VVPGQHLSLKVSKTKELIVHTPIHIDVATVKRVKSFNFLCVHITKDIIWSAMPLLPQKAKTI
jgi:hypothetical protein